ncbi:hypothetical protein [Isoptericola sp. BMS4]|uniref:hypothetical protein n=1 Tax=Isoptericola sp. BMS4 TaxID=2527875 RepID=UPI00196B3E47|nr:hypothetical protein [Isoptericola sp. BMS4]
MIGKPAYTLRDLAADAAALARRLDDRPTGPTAAPSRSVPPGAPRSWGTTPRRPG